MDDLDVDVTSGDVRVRVTGLKKVVRDMSKAGVDAEDIKDLMFAAGEIVARRASWLAPVRGGALRNNIRVGRSKTKASIKVGSARVPYARFAYFGKKDEQKGMYQKANPFIYDALNATRTQVFNKIDTGIVDILKKHDLY